MITFFIIIIIIHMTLIFSLNPLERVAPPSVLVAMVTGGGQDSPKALWEIQFSVKDTGVGVATMSRCVLAPPTHLPAQQQSIMGTAVQNPGSRGLWVGDGLLGHVGSVVLRCARYWCVV